MHSSPKVKKHLGKLNCFQVGETKIPGQQRIINLASNENAMPVSANVSEALELALLQANRYSDNTCEFVIDELCRLYGYSAKKLMCGNGSAELIFLLAEVFAAQEDEILIWKYGYLFYETAAIRVGASIVRTNSEDFLDVNALLSAVTERTKLVFLDNPNNPTGAYIGEEKLRELREKLRSDILLVIDAAYAEYVMEPDYIDGAVLVEEYDNVCLLHTFSKIYGLAGARLGWLYGPAEIINVMRALQQPASVSRIAQYAAVAALREPDRIQYLREQNQKLRDDIKETMLSLGMKPYPTQTNFILIDFFTEKAARHVFAELKNHGIIVRPMSAYGLVSCLRITIGSTEEMQVLKSAMISINNQVGLSCQ